MKILALDSTALTATVALCENEKLIAEYTVNSGNTHSENLLPMIESMLKICKMNVSDIDLFACAAGPGSFTGVRIGAATIKGLAFDTCKPCIGVSTLQALAYNLKGYDGDGIICPVMNARRGQVYNALFDFEGKRLCEDRALSIEELATELAQKKVFLCGDGSDITMSGFNGRVNAKIVPEKLVYQSAYSVSQCALNDYLSGVRTTDIELTPVYLRLSQAERERLARESGSLENIEREK